MNHEEKRRLLGLASTLVLLGGCGANVDLGGKRPSGALTNEPPEMTEPDASGSSSVAKLTQLHLNNVAVAGDYLYFHGFEGSALESSNQNVGIYRCEKDRCEPSLSLLVEGNFRHPQVFNGRLGVVSLGDQNYGFTSFALPDASDLRIVLRDLPEFHATPALFTADFVYFALVADANIYRCAQPDCATGPEVVGPIHTGNFVELHLEADQLFWSDDSFIYRARDSGRAPPQTLLPDELLSEAPAEALNPEAPPHDSVGSLAVEHGMLYASVGRSPDGKPCEVFCAQDIVGWPVDGGARQLLLHSEVGLQSLTVVDGELMWLRPSLKQPKDHRTAALSTCRIEACEATRRDLGEIAVGSSRFAADEHNVYWLEAQPSKPLPSQPTLQFGDTVVDEIRRAPRLPKPQP